MFISSLLGPQKVFCFTPCKLRRNIFPPVVKGDHVGKLRHCLTHTLAGNATVVLSFFVGKNRVYGEALIFRSFPIYLEPTPPQLPIYQVTIDPWFQILGGELEDGGKKKNCKFWWQHVCLERSVATLKPWNHPKHTFRSWDLMVFHVF